MWVFMSSSRFLLVAAMTRTSISLEVPPPCLSMVFSYSTLKSLACILGDMSQISSKKIVPLCASSNLPV